MSKLDFIKADMKNLKEQGFLIKIRTIGSSQGAWINVDGKKVLNMCSNNLQGPPLEEPVYCRWKCVPQFGRRRITLPDHQCTGNPNCRSYTSIDFQERYLIFSVSK